METNLKDYLKRLTNFLAKKKYTKKPFPKFVLRNDNNEGVFVPTGYYDPDKKEIHLFIRNRHPKDILRSAAHELIHHNQNMEGRLNTGSYEGDKIINDDKLLKLEEEAYLKGNIGFRQWTETEQKNKRK